MTTLVLYGPDLCLLVQRDNEDVLVADAVLSAKLDVEECSSPPLPPYGYDGDCTVGEDLRGLLCEDVWTDRVANTVAAP
jgi:hypothetical protein